MTQLATCADNILDTCAPQTLRVCSDEPPVSAGVSMAMDLRFGPVLEDWNAHGKFERREHSYTPAGFGTSGVRYGPYIFIQPEWYRETGPKPPDVPQDDWDARPPLSILDAIRYRDIGPPNNYLFALPSPFSQTRLITWPNGSSNPRVRFDYRFQEYRSRRGPIPDFDPALHGVRWAGRCLPQGNPDAIPPCSDIAAQLASGNIPFTRMAQFNLRTHFSDTPSLSSVAYQRFRENGDLQITVRAVDITGPPRPVTLAEWAASRHSISVSGTWPNFSYGGYDHYLPRATGLRTCSDGIPNHGYIGGFIYSANCGGGEVIFEDCLPGAGAGGNIYFVSFYRAGMRGSFTGNFFSPQSTDDLPAGDPQRNFDWRTSFVAGQFGQRYVHRHQSIGFSFGVGSSCGCLENSVLEGSLDGFCQYSSVNHEEVTPGPYPVAFSVSGVTEIV